MNSPTPKKQFKNFLHRKFCFLAKVTVTLQHHFNFSDMRKKVIILCVALLGVAFLTGCGSTWEISGNNMTVTKLEKPTELPAGTIVITVDTLHNVNDSINTVKLK